MQKTANMKTMSLSELQHGIRETLLKNFPESLWVTGEISELTENSSGHCYLDLVEKDRQSDRIVARVRGNIWASTYRMLKPYFETATGYTLAKGIKILVKAGIEYHSVFGLSLNILDIDPSYTLGDLEQKRKEIIMRLEKDGIINMNRQLPMPPVPQKIAIISSVTAAGYGDFTDQLAGNPHGYVFYAKLFPAVMQGDKAEASIISALERIFEYAGVFDLVVIIRGGGPKSDLACFDSYDLAFHISQFPLPVITGIGHEQDDTITDLVAHTRLKTPTAVAGYLIDSLADFEATLEDLRRQVIRTGTDLLTGFRLRIQMLNQKAASVSGMRLGHLKEKTDRLSTGIRHAVAMELEKQKSRLEKLDRIRMNVDPVQVLKLGYSISRYKGRVIRDAGAMKKGDPVETTLGKGRLESAVTRILKR